jgi:hypothetical protein
MSDAIQFHSRVGDDGVLNLQVNLGHSEAKKEVVVTIKPLSVGDDLQQTIALPWSQFIDRTYGSCADSGLRRHEQGEFESREPIA